MNFVEGACSRTAERAGTCMFILWTFILGPLGLIFLLGLAYAMHVANLALGIVCGLLILSPILILTAWTVLMGAACTTERSTDKGTLVRETIPT